jgi:opacity protein-like surface antigen
VAHVSVNDLSIGGVTIADDSDTVFAWQIGGGLGWELNPNWGISLNYRWFSTSDPEFRDELGGDFSAEYSSHNLTAGLTYTV